MNEKMNGGISTMRGIFCRLSFQKGGITAETIAAQGFDGGIFSVDTRQRKPCSRNDYRVTFFAQVHTKVHTFHFALMISENASSVKVAAFAKSPAI